MAILSPETGAEFEKLQREKAEETRKRNLANFIGQERPEAKALFDSLAQATKPVRYETLITQARRRIAVERQRDGKVSPYLVTSRLLRDTLEIMEDLGAVKYDDEQKRLSFTQRTLDVMKALSEHKPVMGGDYRHPAPARVVHSK